MPIPTAFRILLLCVIASTLSAAPVESRPNIVVILADDMGHGFVSCLYPQSKIQTPNIDRLSREGVTFTDAHSGSAVCSPTRYGLLTGRYAWRTHLKSGVLKPYDPPLIEANRLTLPSFLRQQGYQTACIGKWHLGWDWPREGANDPDFTKPIANGPLTRGFDYYFGTHVPNQPPYCFIENDRTVGLPTARKTESTLSTSGQPGPMLPGWKFDAILPGITERAVSYLSQRSHTNQPFFLYFPLTSPHEPVAPSASFREKSGLNPLADFVIETDAVVGKILDALEKYHLSTNTLVIFTADNGSNLTTGGKELQKKGHEPSGIFRGSKRSIYEGGHRVPFFARWPGRIKPGLKTDEVICLTDLFPTTAAILKTKLPSDAAPDGYNILPALLGDKTKGPIREATVHQSSEGQLAIRQGQWKLIAPRERKSSAFELYDLSFDISEAQNIAAQHPDIVKRLDGLLVKYQAGDRSAH
jgi:arylsulfatase A